MTRARLTAAATACAAVIGGACAGGGEPASGRDRVTAVVVPYLTMTPFHIAAEEGYFAEQNLDVEFRRIARNQDVMASLANGDVDVASGMLSVNELSLAAAGARIRMIAAMGEIAPDGCPFVAVVARREHLESGALSDPERIRDLRFDFNRVLPLAYFLDAVIGPLGVTTDELDVVDLPPATALESLRNGAVDVTVDSDPYITRHLAGGHAVIWGALQELFPHYAVSVMMFGPTLLDERREVGERFATALLKALRRAAEGKTPGLLALVEREIGLTPEVARAACWPIFTETGRIDPSVFRGFQEWSVDHGLVDRVLDDDELFDQHFMDVANAELAR